MIEFLLAVDWGIALLMLAGTVLLVSIIAAICWFKTDINTELIVFFCATSLLMAPLMSVAWGAYGSIAWSRAMPRAAITENVKTEEVYDIPKIYEYNLEIEEEE